VDMDHGYTTKVRQMLKHKNQQMLKNLTKIVWFKQFPEIDSISHGADVVEQSVSGGMTRVWERPLTELRAQPW